MARLKHDLSEEQVEILDYYMSELFQYSIQGFAEFK